MYFFFLSFAFENTSHTREMYILRAHSIHKYGSPISFYPIYGVIRISEFRFANFKISRDFTVLLLRLSKLQTTEVSENESLNYSYLVQYYSCLFVCVSQIFSRDADKYNVDTDAKCNRILRSHGRQLL